MAQYEQQADQAIIDEDWREATRLLNLASVHAEEPGDAYKPLLRKAALPLYQDAVHCENGRGSQLTDSTAQEVHEEVVNVLRYAHRAYDDMYPAKQAVYAGTLAEFGVMSLCTYARTQQIDDTLVTPALWKENHRSGLRNHDLNMYNPRITWNQQARTPIQLKHTAYPGKVVRYDPSVVVVGYTGHREIRLDKFSVGHEDSINSLLLREKTPTREQYLNFRYGRLNSLAIHWPMIRKTIVRQRRQT